jgi:hypothetical protein
MKRFPNYKDVTEYENSEAGTSIPDNLVLNYLIQILRRNRILYNTTPIFILRKLIESNARINYISDYLRTPSIIQNYSNYFDCTYYRNNRDLIHSVDLSDDLLDFEVKEMDLNNYCEYGDPYDILEVTSKKYIIVV